MTFSQPTSGGFKARFDRDFPYEPTPAEGETIDPMEYVRDTDINRAINSAARQINQELFSQQSDYTEAFLMLAAHFLVVSLRAGAQGIRGGFSWLESSKSVGSVSTGISIPPRIASNPRYSALCQTAYGGQYLMMIYPLLVGSVFSVEGGTRG